jgi:hypothetical protein
MTLSNRTVPSDNAEQIAEWNGALGQRWVAMQEQLDRVVVGRHVERRPAAMRVELVVAAKQLGVAGAAAVHADRLGVGVLTNIRGFSGGLAQHRILGRRQLSAPFIVGLLDLIHDAKGT